MKYDTISEKFYNNGASIKNIDSIQIKDLNREEIIAIFEKTGVIVFQEFKSDPNKGEQKACKEWLQKNSHIKLIEYGNNQLTQKMFIVNLDN